MNVLEYIFWNNNCFKAPDFNIFNMAPGDYISLEISKGDPGYSIEAVVPGGDGIGPSSCKDFGDVLSKVILYRDIIVDSDSREIRFGRQSLKHFSSDEAGQLETLADMHNQLVEIKRTFKIRKEE